MILSITILGLMFIGCDTSTEPLDCAGVAGGAAVVDSAGVCVLAWNEGTYNLTSAAMYEGEACSGTAVTGFCYDEISSEADCPATCCYDEASDDCTDATTEAACTDGQWMTGICIIDGVDSDEASADACVTAGGNWFDGFWLSLADIYSAMEGNNSATFGADGVFTSIEGDTGTYTVVDNVITTATTCCYDNDTDDCTDAETVEACTDGEWEVDTISGTFNTDGTITLEEVDEAGCENGMYETKTECEAASSEWYDAECISTVWTLSPSQ